MRTSTMKYLSGLSVAMILACLIGCDRFKPRSTPPGPTTMGGTVAHGAYTFLRWKGGPTILICSDFGGTSSHGSGTTEDPVWRESGYHASHDGRRFEWHSENTKSLDVKFTLAGKEYDLTNGTMFLVTVTNGETEVQQINRDLSGVQFTAESSQAFMRQDPDVSKLIKP
jgi:hypothetical protein